MRSSVYTGSEPTLIAGKGSAERTEPMGIGAFPPADVSSQGRISAAESKISASSRGDAVLNTGLDVC